MKSRCQLNRPASLVPDSEVLRIDGERPNDMTAIPVIRADVWFDPEPRRVIIRPFLPDERILPDNPLLQRILAIAHSKVAATLGKVRSESPARPMSVRG